MCYGNDRHGLARCEAKKGEARVRKKAGSTMLHGLQGLLLYSAHRRNTMDTQSLLHRQRTSTASHQALGGGTRGPRGARGPGQTSTTPSSAPCRPPPDFEDTIFCTLRAAVRQPAPTGCIAAARGGLAGSDYTFLCTLRAAIRQPALAGCRAAARGRARRLRRQHLLHSTGRRPAAGSGRLQGCGAREARWL
jgi:hypothetical protein